MLFGPPWGEVTAWQAFLEVESGQTQLPGGGGLPKMDAGYYKYGLFLYLSSRLYSLEFLYSHKETRKSFQYVF